MTKVGNSELGENWKTNDQ